LSQATGCIGEADLAPPDAATTSENVSSPPIIKIPVLKIEPARSFHYGPLLRRITLLLSLDVHRYRMSYFEIVSFSA
jgi:hypothetical protein